MPNPVVVTTNLPDFKRQLIEVGLRVERRVTARAVSAAARVFRKEARELAPELQTPAKHRNRVRGALRRAIYSGRSKFQRRGEVRFYVGVRASKKVRKTARDPFYWRFLEAGWMPRGPGRKLMGGNRSRALQRERAAAAGARKVAYPFLKPAYERGKGEALRAFVSKMDAELTKEVALVR